MSSLLKTAVFALLIGLMSVFVWQTPAKAQEITNEQRAALNGPSALRPGLYRMQPRHSPHCLGFAHRTGPREAHLYQAECTNNGPVLMLLPHPSGSYTIRTGVGVTRPWETCATIARGVVIGPPAIDVLPCVASGSGSVCEVGAPDQRFTFGRDVYNNYIVENFNSGADWRRGCWDVRDRSPNVGVELIFFVCGTNRTNPNQRFEMEYWGDSTGSPENEDCLRALGYAHTYDGWRRIVPVTGVDLPGEDFINQPTANDNGAQCAQACADTAGCRAFTWVRPGVQNVVEGSPAMCWLKTGIPQPVANDDTASGIVRP